MQRVIEGFHQDDVGDWVAELSCLHSQHVRHRPPFFDRPWVEREDGRRSRLGTALECPLCDRGELPDGLRRVRTAGPFDADSLPAGLRRDHVVAPHTWAVARVLDGAVTLTLDEPPATSIELAAGAERAIPPGVRHALVVEGPMRVEVDFYVRR